MNHFSTLGQQATQQEVAIPDGMLPFSMFNPHREQPATEVVTYFVSTHEELEQLRQYRADAKELAPEDRIAFKNTRFKLSRRLGTDAEALIRLKAREHGGMGPVARRIFTSAKSIGLECAEHLDEGMICIKNREDVLQLRDVLKAFIDPVRKDSLKGLQIRGETQEIKNALKVLFRNYHRKLDEARQEVKTDDASLAAQQIIDNNFEPLMFKPEPRRRFKLKEKRTPVWRRIPRGVSGLLSKMRAIAAL